MLVPTELNVSGLNEWQQRDRIFVRSGGLPVAVSASSMPTGWRGLVWGCVMSGEIPLLGACRERVFPGVCSTLLGGWEACRGGPRLLLPHSHAELPAAGAIPGGWAVGTHELLCKGSIKPLHSQPQEPALH